MLKLRDVLLGFQLRELLGFDLAGGALAGIGGIWLAVEHGQVVRPLASVLVGLVGVVIGAVIAAVALVAAFLDSEFLRKLEEIDESPLEFVGPFMFTAVLGIVAAITLGVAAATPSTAPTWVVATSAGLGTGFGAWTTLSLVRDLDILVQFVQVQQAAARLPAKPTGSVAPLPPQRRSNRP